LARTGNKLSINNCRFSESLVSRPPCANSLEFARKPRTTNLSTWYTISIYLIENPKMPMPSKLSD